MYVVIFVILAQHLSNSHNGTNFIATCGCCIENALFDAPGRGRNAEITDEEKAWIIKIACQKPIDFGYAAETWTYAKLTSHINKTAEAAGYTRLSTIHKSTINTILDKADIKPHKITYDAEKFIVSDGMPVHVLFHY